MAHERSTIRTHIENPDQKRYDWAYYNALMPHIYGRVLDVGCGAGMFIEQYIDKDSVDKVYGVDKYIDELKDHAKLTKIQNNDPSKMKFYPNYFDTVVSTEFIEHITREELEPLLVNIKEEMKPEAVFVGSTPNKVQPTTNPYHLYEYTLNELKEIFEKYFTRVEMWDNGEHCTLWKVQK